MKIANENPAFARVTRRGGLLTLLAGALALAGCGGGDGGGSSQAAVSAGGTGSGSGSTNTGGSLSVGPISGMGSIIVNGVRFEDKAAKILDDDGVAIDRKDLKLGMMARVKGKAKSRKDDKTEKTEKTDEAEEITVGSDLLGPIEIVPTTLTIPATLTVLGQTVQLTVGTVFGEGVTLADLLLNVIVEVHGFVNPDTNVLIATRIERRDLATVKDFKLQGVIRNINPTARTFEIGGRTITFDSAVELAKLILADLINGLHVRVRLEKTSTGKHKAKHIRKVREDDEDDRDECEVKGTITEFISVANFTVNGRRIDASGIVGLVALKVGLRVEVEGKMKKGVLVAKKVELEVENDPAKFVLHGTATVVVILDPNAQFFTFTLTSSGGIVVKVTVSRADAIRIAQFLKLNEAELRAKLAAGINKIRVEAVALPDGSFKANNITIES